MNEQTELAVVIAQATGQLMWGQANAIAAAVLRAGYRREQTAPEPATSGENISAQSWPDNLLQHPEN